MHVKGEDLIYYISIYNENYAAGAQARGRRRGHPPRASTASPMRRRSRAATAEGDAAGPPRRLRARSCSQVIAAQALLAEKLGIAAEVYSAPSFPMLRRDALAVDRWNRLHPAEKPRVPYVSTVLGPKGGPIIAATDWMKALPDLVRPWIDAPFVTLGTDGFGRSDTRESLRAYFEIDPPSIAAAAVSALARAGDLTAETAAKAPSPSSASTPEKVDPLEA